METPPLPERKKSSESLVRPKGYVSGDAIQRSPHWRLGLNPNKFKNECVFGRDVLYFADKQEAYDALELQRGTTVGHVILTEITHQPNGSKVGERIVDEHLN